MKVPFLDLKIQNKLLSDEILASWKDILESSQFIGGEHVIEFEKEFAKACETDYCVCVNSGTDALRFIFIALGLNNGDEVITVPNTFIATTEAISQAGGKIVFVDIDSDTYNMDSKKIIEKITPRTVGIVPVHLYGQPADMEPICTIAKKYGLWVVEDACQAHLARYKGHKVGSIGIAAAFSFYPGKNLGACGDCGAVTTNDSMIASKIRALRDHGQTEKYYHEMEGYNGRCDALQAVVLRIKLKYLESWNEERRKNAQYYFELLSTIDKVGLPYIMDECVHVYHLFVIQVDKRDLVAEELKKRGIDTGLHYPLPLHIQPAYFDMNIPVGSFPVAEACAKRILSLPMFPELTRAQMCYVRDSLREILNDL